MPGKHSAALLPQKGGPLVVGDRDTPEPGPNEVLIEVKAIAVNPADYYQRDRGMPPVPIYPAVLGSDVSGLVAKVGSKVSKAPAIGSRVLALASSYYQNGSPDHGAFQKYTLAQSEAVIALPDKYSFEEGAILPLATLTALSGWTTIGLPLETKYTPEDKQAVLIWGGAASVGTLAIQSAKSMGFTVYATASLKNLAYLDRLGADAVFNYKSGGVGSEISETALRAGVTLLTANCIVDGALEPTLDVLKRVKQFRTAKVAHTPVLPPGAPTADGVEVTFNQPPMDQTERDEHMYKVFHVWLQDGLKSGSVVPSPAIQIQDGGLEGLNKALDKLKEGVSCKKIVVRI